MQQNRHVEAATALAATLNIENYNVAEMLLTPQCQYKIGETTVSGSVAIIESYRLIGDWVKATFESYSYESKVAADGDDQAIITYRDRIRHGEHRLDHHCQQVVKADQQGRIFEIRHVDLPGEPEKVAAFNAACGVSKPQ